MDGWNPIWDGPRDYRCEVCHNGFTYEEFVYIEKDGLPFHKNCLDPVEFRNRMRRGVTIITPPQRLEKLSSEKPTGEGEAPDEQRPG